MNEAFLSIIFVFVSVFFYLVKLTLAVCFDFLYVILFDLMITGFTLTLIKCKLIGSFCNGLVFLMIAGIKIWRGSVK